MRSIIILAMFGTLLLLPVVSSAETNMECVTRCAAEKASKDANCPSSDDPDQRTQCLQESQEGYNSCIANCPQPEPGDTPAAN